jgi:hypothetical protein
MSGSRAGDPVVAAAFSGCKGFVFATNSGDSIAGYLDSSTVVGRSFRASINADAPCLFLGNDAKMIGDTAVVGTESSAYAAYYGELSLARGLGVSGAVTAMPRLYENPDSIDNRASGLFWGMGKTRAAFGVALDAGTTMTLRGEYGFVSGTTPAVVIDARAVSLVDFPAWRDPGKPHPRQNAAFVGGVINVVREGQSYRFSDGTLTAAGGIGAPSPDGFTLAQNYPNPFNPATTIRYAVPAACEVHLAVYDLLGRQVGLLVGQRVEAGVHSATFDAKHLASGVYVYQLRAGVRFKSGKMIVLR